ncbi:MAG: SAM-dependent methyltransferase, partial [Acinetobacter sp.]
QRLDLDFQSWTERMKTPEYAITTIRDLQTKASEQVQRYYQIKVDGSFSSDVAYIVLSK